MFCPKCGAENSSEAKFCRSCGHAFESVKETDDGQAQLQSKAKRSRRHDKKIIISAVAVMCVACALFIGGRASAGKLTLPWMSKNKAQQASTSADENKMQAGVPDSKSEAKVQQQEEKNEPKNVEKSDACSGQCEECSPNYIKWDGIEASSVLPPSSSGNYVAQNVDDWNGSTAWAEGVEGDGQGSWILFKSTAPRKVKGIEIDNGYKKSPQIFASNNRVKKVKVEFSDGSSIIKELTDGYDMNNNISLNKETSTTYIKITILEVYKGSKYSDTCMSGVHAY